MGVGFGRCIYGIRPNVRIVVASERNVYFFTRVDAKKIKDRVKLLHGEYKAYLEDARVGSGTVSKHDDGVANVNSQYNNRMGKSFMSLKIVAKDQVELIQEYFDLEMEYAEVKEAKQAKEKKKIQQLEKTGDLLLNKSNNRRATRTVDNSDDESCLEGVF